MVHCFTSGLGCRARWWAIHTTEQVTEETDMILVRYGLGELEMFGGHGMELANDW